jgi:DUF1680 family protein
VSRAWNGIIIVTRTRANTTPEPGNRKRAKPVARHRRDQRRQQGGAARDEGGPLVYCFEQADQPVALEELAVGAGTPLTERAATVDGAGPTVQAIADGRPVLLPAIAIPYFQWDNRGPGAMRVWIPGD